MIIPTRAAQQPTITDVSLSLNRQTHPSVWQGRQRRLRSPDRPILFELTRRSDESTRFIFRIRDWLWRALLSAEFRRTLGGGKELG